MLFFLCVSSCCFTSLTHPLLYNTKTGLNKQYGHKMEKPTALREEGALCSNRLVAHTFSWGLFFQDLCEPAGGRPKKNTGLQQKKNKRAPPRPEGCKGL